MGKRKRRMCFLCEKRPARKLKAVTHDKREYAHAANEAVFCSVRCAANWALISVMEEGNAGWCPKHGSWHISEDGCLECHDESIESS